MRRSAGRPALAAAALTCAAALAGCASSGSSQPGASGSTATASPSAASSSGNTPAVASPSPSSPAAAGPAACPTSSLRVTEGVAQGYAGGVYVVIDFTNTSDRTCTLFGYPGVSFVTSPSGSQLGRAATRNPPTATLVTLAPGGVAHAVLRVADAGNYSPSACVPVTAHWVRVYPPNQFNAIYARYKTQVCSARLPASIGRQVSVYVVRPGPGKAGQAP